MRLRHTSLIGAAISVGLMLGVATTAAATPSPNGLGQPGAPGTTCGMADASASPGRAANAPGSPFNESGIAGAHYAGNPGTASAAHAGSVHAVSQYDIACFQVTTTTR